MATKLIRSDDLAGGYSAWQAPEVSGPTVRGRASDAEDVRGARQRAYQEGLEQGRAAGIEAGRRDIAARAQVLEQVLAALSRPFEGLDHRFQDEIVALVRAITRQLIRREMRLDPGHIVGVVRDGLAALPMARNDIVVRLHPEDAAVIRECLATDTDGRAWRIEADPVMERGGCLIVTPQSQVDGRLDTRLARAIAALFEDERKDDAETPGSDSGQ
jgi:flagellar assembly protein FliH